MKTIIGILTILFLTGCQTQQVSPYDFAAVCKALPNQENAKLPLSEASDDWFQVYEASEGVFSIVEPFHIQGTISHLIVGRDRALLFDTGIGLLPIRPVVERITDLPVTVLNSHTHYDHVGGNAEFSSILAIDSDYTRANMAGFDHATISEDFGEEAFCIDPPTGVDLSSFHTKPWKASRYVKDGEILDLGGRRLEVLHVPGHTPDATALLDADKGLLFTGDTFYDAEIWLFVPETNLDDYDRAISRLVDIENKVKYLLGAHVSARVDTGRLAKVKAAFRKLRSGDFIGELTTTRSFLRVDEIEFTTSKQVLEGKQGDITKGGSGLDTWD
ncbi:MAG: MBL fold metallo-hydrolase [Gammaproteobacteria bacterium]|nr:MBL fold metallo-hydrolase [Gammaproteobacteria bacterium]